MLGKRKSEERHKRTNRERDVEERWRREEMKNDVLIHKDIFGI